ncbi:MAG: hypothetical protein AB1894_21690 [Chloroflexota bacterium]
MLRKLAFLLLGLVSLAACAPIEKIEQSLITQKEPLQAGRTLGQTFVARYEGLQEIAIYLEPLETGRGKVQVRLFPDPETATELAAAELPLQNVSHAGYFYFRFAPLPASTQQYYFVQIEIQGEGRVNAGAAPGNAYLNGALYVDQAPQDAQLAFRLGYQPYSLALGLVKESSTWLALLGAGLLLFVLPGWALFSVAWPGWPELHWSAKLGLGSGMSLVIYPVLLLWTDLFGLHLGALYAWLPILAGTGILAWRHRHISKSHPIALWKEAWKRCWHSADLWPNLALFGLIGLIFLTRAWVIRGLEAPMWGDGYQHTVMVQLIQDHNGLFDSWLPYAEIESLNYHFGFHILAAAFQWITRLPVQQAVLWTGQILNALAVVSLLPLVMLPRRSLWAGLVAILLAGLLSPMPMYYVNWSRYTQLAAQVILPAFVAAAWSLFEAKPIQKSAGLAACLLLAGLALTHYRVLLLALCALPAGLLLTGSESRSGKRLLEQATTIFWIGAGSLLLFLPWLARIYSGKIMHIFVHSLQTLPSQAGNYVWQANRLDHLSAYLPVPVWLLLALAMGWGLWKRNRYVARIGAWWFFILLATNPNWLNLPGMGLITNFAIAIAAYIPAGFLIGAAGGELLESLSAARRIAWQARSSSCRAASLAWLPALFTVALLCGGLWGARQRLWDANPIQHALVTRPDRIAASWIQANLPAEARFLVNGSVVYNGIATAGSDGGWWLPLIARRASTLPPMNDVLEGTGQMATATQLYTEISAKGLQSPEVLALLHQQRVTHVYLGQRQGQINPASPAINPADLFASPSYELIYHRDNVYIFAIK